MDRSGSPPSGKPNGTATMVFMLAMSAWAPVSLIAAGAILGSTNVRGITVAAWAALVLAMTPVFLRLARRAVGDGAPVAVGLGLMSLAPALFFGAAVSWGEPVVMRGWRCGTGDIGFVMIGVPMTALGTLIAAGVGTWLARWRPPPAHMTAAAAGLAAVTTLALVALAVPRLGRPAANEWVESVPLVATLDFSATGPDGRPFAGNEAFRVGPRALLERSCHRMGEGEHERSYCEIRMWRVPEGVGIGEGVVVPRCDEDWLLAGSHDPSLPLCPPSHGSNPVDGRRFEVRHDLEHGYWIVAGTGRHALPRAFSGDLEPTEIEPMHLGASIAPPLSWWALAILGVMCVVLVLVRRVRLVRRRRAFAKARPGRVEGGDVLFDDGELPARGVLAAATPDGPCVALPTTNPGHPGYRDDGGRGTWHAEPGDRATIQHRLRLAITAHDLLVLGLLALTAVPLLVALR